MSESILWPDRMSGWSDLAWSRDCERRAEMVEQAAIRMERSGDAESAKHRRELAEAMRAAAKKARSRH